MTYAERYRSRAVSFADALEANGDKRPGVKLTTAFVKRVDIITELRGRGLALVRVGGNFHVSTSLTEES